MAYPLLLHPLVLNQDVPTLGTELGLDEQTRLELRKELVGQLVTIEQEPRIAARCAGVPATRSWPNATH